MKRNKLKVKKSLVKRVKITGTGLILRHHQLYGGHLKRKKSKQAKARAKRMTQFSKGDEKKVKRMLGI